MSEIEWNTVKYIDCMDTEQGLPSLADKSVDLCLTDFPYNINKTSGFTRNNYSGNTNRMNKRKIFYKDKMNPIEYKKWCYSVFKQLQRVCKGIIFTPGYKNKEIWFDYDHFEILMWVNHYRKGESKIAKYNWFELILCWGEFNYKFKKSVLEYNFGFNMVFDYMNLVHPHPKPLRLYEWIVKSTRSESVIDPFLGSGTTAEVCTKLGIKWLGYEINEVYAQDINKRLKNCKREPKQITLEAVQWV